MKRLEAFEEWLALEVENLNADEEKIWPARIKFDPENGIEIDTINFADFSAIARPNLFQRDVISGYLDYSIPCTLINTIARSFGSIRFGSRQYSRANYKLYASGFIKNVHLKNIDEQCFSGFKLTYLGFQSWLSPQLINKNYNNEFILENISFNDCDSEEKKVDALGVVKLYSGLIGSQHINDYKLQHQAVLEFDFYEPRNYSQILDMILNLKTIFDFLVGARFINDIIPLKLIKKNEKNDFCAEEVELFISLKRKRIREKLDSFNAMYTKDRCPINLEKILNLSASAKKDIMYFMNVILSTEANDLNFDDSYIEITGCLEALDRKEYKNDQENGRFKKLRKSIKNKIKLLLTEEEINFSNSSLDSFKVEYSLKQRLDRLISSWQSDGFKGSPNTGRLRDLRNMKPHGRSHELSHGIIQEMVHYNYFLCALSRYHILKSLGFSREDIAKGFCCVRLNYGCFIPDDLITLNR